jgi:hypothetical protein
VETSDFVPTSSNDAWTDPTNAVQSAEVPMRARVTCGPNPAPAAPRAMGGLIGGVVVRVGVVLGFLVGSVVLTPIGGLLLHSPWMGALYAWTRRYRPSLGPVLPRISLVPRVLLKPGILIVGSPDLRPGCGDLRHSGYARRLYAANWKGGS